MNTDELFEKSVGLFAGISREDLRNLLDCMDARTVAYTRGETLWVAGDRLHRFGVVLEGHVRVYREDILGNRTLMTAVTPPGLVGEVIACAGLPESPVTAEAGEEARVLLLSFDRIIRPCAKACAFHSQLIRNMLGIFAQKNIALSEKIGHLSRKTTRQKLASYLISEGTRQRSRVFTVPLDRQALADYLGVNRSALSRELSAICDTGAISCSRSRFELRDPRRLEEMLREE